MIEVARTMIICTRCARGYPADQIVWCGAAVYLCQDCLAIGAQGWIVVCTRTRQDGSQGQFREWHLTLDEALGAMLEHQQKAWDSVALMARSLSARGV